LAQTLLFVLRGVERLCAMQVRRATELDAWAIARVHESAIRAVTAYSAEQIDSWAAHIAPEAYLPYMAVRDFFVAVDEGVVVGFAELHRDGAEVGAVYVDPSWQRKGVGRLLMQAIDFVAREAGIHELKVIASSNAIPFYTASGFTTREESTYRTRGGVAIPCAVMLKPLAPGTRAVKR
jgi:N-acetylglutamate synthase-like GNAT family acetyltransferase